MVKGVSPIISFVLLVLISISAIYLVLYVAKPTIDRAYESAAMNEAGQNMQLLDNAIREVASEGTGGLRKIVMKVSDGDYRIVNMSENFTGAVQYKIDLKYSPYTAPMLKSVGNLKYSSGMNAIGLVGYWNLDDRNGTIADDKSDYGNDGTLYSGSASCANPPTIGAGCPQWVDGKYGGALSFDGSNDNITVSASASLNLTNWSISVWINPSTIAQSLLVGKGTADNVNAHNYFLYLYNDGDVGFGFQNGTGEANLVRDEDTITATDRWYNLVFTKNATVYTLYLNGTYRNSENVIGTPIANNLPLIIGGIAANARWFNGSIDEVRIYDRALTVDEVKENYNTDPSNYQVILEYSKIIIAGTSKFGKGDHIICIEKTGELNNKPLVSIAGC